LSTSQWKITTSQLLPNYKQAKEKLP